MCVFLIEHNDVHMLWHRFDQNNFFVEYIFPEQGDTSMMYNHDNHDKLRDKRLLRVFKHQSLVVSAELE